MRIALVSSEMVPMVKVGGLGDTVASLAQAMKEAGHEVTVIIPYYMNYDLNAFSFARRLIPITIIVGGKETCIDVYECKLGSGVQVISLGCPEYLNQGTIYAGDEFDPIRFGVFSKGVSRLLQGEKEKFDVVHCHDWHTALVAFFLRKGRMSGNFAGKFPVVLTVHNMAHQGIANKSLIDLLDLGWENFTPHGIEYYGKVNILKAGLISSDAVTTVSSTYAREVLGPVYGAGMEGVLKSLKVPFSGILNGIDTSKWNPANGIDIAAPFSSEDMQGKKLCREDLQRVMGLPVNPSVTLIGVVSRLTSQKGMDLLLGILPRLLRLNIQLVILGEGDHDLEERFLSAASLWREKIAVRISFDEKLSRKIYAGSDLFLMPSRFEPCGIGAMIAMRYGSVVVARSTGGLADTVIDVDRNLDTGTGFSFKEIDSVDFLGAVLRAIAYRRLSDEWNSLLKRIMTRDFSWKSSLKKYIALFNDLLK